MLPRFTLIPLGLLVSVQLRAQQPQGRYDARPWWVAAGVSIGTPGGLGAQVEMKLIGPLWVRGVARGVWGTLPRGAGLDWDVARGVDGRLYVTATVGTIACYGDRDGVCSGTPRLTSRAWSLGAGGEFPVSRVFGAGVEAERWFAVSGEHPSLFAAAFLVRAHF